MAKTGRRSAAERSVIRPAGGFNRRLRPPADLGEAEQSVWRQIVLACDERHFEPSDAPLLVRYCQNVVLARRAADALTAEGAVIGGRPNPWLVVSEKCDRALVALSMRLRISRQARLISMLAACSGRRSRRCRHVGMRTSTSLVAEPLRGAPAYRGRRNQRRTLSHEMISGQTRA
jgi:phage terminase small subunit